jgi:hypothetical protein
MKFKDYDSKPVVRKAYQITPDDSIYKSLLENGYSIGKRGMTFYTAETPVAGGWVVYLDKDDVYYCSDKVFRERNVVS